MGDDLIFYTHPMSRGRMVRWMLEEVGEPYRTEVIEYGPPMKGPAYRAVNPMGKVPALRHGDAVVTEAAAVIAYLADAFPAAGLAPPVADPLRAPYYRWLFFVAGPLEAACVNEACGFEVPPQRRGMVGYGSLAAVVDTLEAAVEGRAFLVGDRFTAADLYLAAGLGWMMHVGMVERRPAFQRYCEPLAARPAASRARAIDDALLAEHPMPQRQG